MHPLIIVIILIAVLFIPVRFTARINLDIEGFFAEMKFFFARLPVFSVWWGLTERGITVKNCKSGFKKFVRKENSVSVSPEKFFNLIRFDVRYYIGGSFGKYMAGNAMSILGGIASDVMERVNFVTVPIIFSENNYLAARVPFWTFPAKVLYGLMCLFKKYIMRLTRRKKNV